MEWRTIESAPKDETPILAIWSGKLSPIYGIVWFEDGKWHEWDSSVDVEGMTHWMPLPEPPK